MQKVSMILNGKSVSALIDPRTLLVQFIREHQHLTGTHVGCDTSQCGACVVHVDGKAIKSCTTLALSCEGANVVTIEGLAQGGGHGVRAGSDRRCDDQCPRRRVGVARK